jgi:predicted esterase
MEVATAGPPLAEARGAVILTHGRGGSAADMLALAGAFDRPQFHYVAPQTPGNTWYPYSFLAPIESNEPHLSHALATVGAIVDDVELAGVGGDRIVLGGFSQGACLALEFAARHARRYGGVIGLSGGLIGPEGTPRDYEGSLDGTPVFLGCSDVDPHVPEWRLRETADVMTRLGADVTLRIYPGMGHTVNPDEIEHVRALLDRL